MVVEVPQQHARARPRAVCRTSERLTQNSHVADSTELPGGRVGRRTLPRANQRPRARRAQSRGQLQAAGARPMRVARRTPSRMIASLTGARAGSAKGSWAGRWCRAPHATGRAASWRARVPRRRDGAWHVWNDSTRSRHTAPVHAPRRHRAAACLEHAGVAGAAVSVSVSVSRASSYSEQCHSD